ncbi:MAG: HAMP domain-containing histidine kinase, partial [Deltaproteobacteria bacterium]|nr:HAMP domain-containing histidine kinase [Deltaproteobacteria bacterium]
LRTPLARIRVALELADEQPERAHARLVGVGRDLAELERLVGDILAMVRLDSGASAPPLRLTLCAPAALVTQIEARWREVHGARALTVTVAEGLPTIACDPVLARRVVDNLLDNAAKYGRGEPVELRVGAHAGRVTFAVIDRGVGMSDEERARAFTPFWRSDQSRTRGTGGVGLGLALARQIARAHGGDVTLDSEPDRGTTATLSLPARPTDDEGASA